MSRRKPPFRRSKQRSWTRLRIESLEDRCLFDAGPVSQLLITTRSGAIETVAVDPGAPITEVLASYEANPDVLTVELDQEVHVTLVPNDSRFGDLWGMRNTGQSGGTAGTDIGAESAWSIATGSLRMAVGIIDTGIDYTHPDLYKNIWLNQGELPTNLGLIDTDGDGLITFWDLNEAANAGKVADVNQNGRIDGGDVLGDPRWANGRDDDGNGKIDDLIGWDFVNNDNDPFDDNSHGTHVAGTIGAMGNNALGVAGVNWKVQLVGLKFLAANGSGYTSAAVAALNYAVGEGISITNNSWGGGGYSAALAAAISGARAAGHIFVAAAGNSATNNDATPHYPSSYTFDNVVAVASMDRYGNLSSFSNYGASSVDLAAPGSSILSTVPGGGYAVYSGTSMATPHVAGAVALVWSAHPELAYHEVIARILDNVQWVSSFAGKMVTGGRLDVYHALASGSTDNTGPRVTSAVANSAGPVASVRVTFSEPIDPSTFTAADITNFVGPQGSLAAGGVQVVAGSNNTQFDVTFAAQTAPGTYRFDVGPDVRDVAGNRMDQNGNGIVGESADTYRATFSIAPPAAATFSNTVPAAIRDYRTTVSTITVGQNLTIADLNVTLTINHTFDGDLYVYLRGPDGTRVDLVRFRGGSGDHFTNTTLDDEAAAAIASGRAPFQGSFRPEKPLSAFDGKNARGTWTLYVYDASRYDTGMLVSWSLTVATSGAAGASARTAPLSARAIDAVLAQLPGARPAWNDALPADWLDVAAAEIVGQTSSGDVAPTSGDGPHA
ncbi:MAG: S8 family serine peptidase, partial [Thermoguttaceae bacterium]|nr:S8 family serine peptidase [Thermoguttaceae bacterium]